MPRNLHIQLLGDFRLLHDGVLVNTIDTPRSQSFLAYLLLHREAPLSRSRLAFLFWPDSNEAQARTNLRKQLYHLRRDLPDADRYLHIDNNALHWRADEGLSLDVDRFERALSRAGAAEQAGDGEAQLEALQRAVDLYRGDLLPDSYDDWVLDERRRLRQAFSGALLTLASLLEDRRDYEAAAGHVRRLLRLDPLHEPAYRQLMRLQALLGNRAAAVKTYQTCVATLEAELGVSPGAATTEVYQQLMQQEAAGFEPGPQPAFPSPLVGRRGEWARLQAAWRAARDGRRQMVELRGPAGIGKTRLAEELLAWARRQGITTAVARCYASEQGLAYGPVAAWLRSEPVRQSLDGLAPAWLGEVARLLPELLVERPDLPPPSPMTEGWQRQHLFEALARAFGRQRQILLLIDDLQWADPETVEWLPYLLHARPASGDARRLLVVATLRTEELPGRQGLGEMLDGLRHDGQLTEIRLGPLAEAESLALARNVAGRPLEPELTAALYRETEGNPLFIVEMVRAAILGPQAGENGPAAAPERWGLPPAVQRAIAARLAHLSPPARDLAGVAAVIGREFTFDVLAHAAAPENGAGDEGATVRALDELWQRDIVRQQGPSTYDFAHDKIRHVVLGELSAARRRYLHRRVARAIAALHGDDLDPVSGRVAAHYERGGEQQAAIAHYRRAAAVARKVYANQEAIGYYRRLLEGDLSPWLSRADACAVMLDLGQVWQLTGDWAAAGQIYRQALAQAEAIEDRELVARCQQAIGNLVRLRGEYDQALDWLSAARDGFAAAGEQRGLAQVLWSLGEAHWYRGDHEQALAALEQQMEIAVAIDDPRLACDAAGTMGIVHWSWGDFEKARAFCRQSIETAQKIDHWWAVGRALITLGNTYSSEGQLQPAAACYQQALEVASEIGDRQCSSWAVINMGNLYEMAGDPESALACYQLGLETALDIGDRWSISVGLVDMAEMYARLDRPAEAERFYQKGIALARALQANYLCEYLLSTARFYAGQERFEEAWRYNKEAMLLARGTCYPGMGGQDTLFGTRLLDIRLRHALGQSDAAAALAELEQMLEASGSAARRAEIWYEIWRLEPAYARDGQRADRIYRQLPPAEIRSAARRRYRDVTGQDPPPPPALLSVEEIVDRTPSVADELLARAGDVLDALDTSA